MRNSLKITPSSLDQVIANIKANYDSSSEQSLEDRYTLIYLAKSVSTLGLDLFQHNITSVLNINLCSKMLNALISVTREVLEVEFMYVNTEVENTYKPLNFDLNSINTPQFDSDLDDLDDLILDNAPQLSPNQSIINEYSLEDSVAVVSFATNRVKVGMTLKDHSPKAFDVIARLYAIRSTIKNDLDIDWTSSDTDKMTEFELEVKDCNTRLLKALAKGNQDRIQRRVDDLDEVLEDAFEHWSEPSEKKVKGQLYYLKTCISLLDAETYSKTIVMELKQKELNDLGSSNVARSHALILEMLQIK